ncbi:MAG: diacylglycerol kinase family protein [Planctomycetota bacterium]
MAEVALLYNPAAGGGGRVAATLAAFARAFGAQAPVLATAADEDGQDLLVAGLRALPPTATVCIAGGDGTLHAALQAVAAARGNESWFRLALVPVGSANDGARALATLTGRSHGADVEVELQAIAARVAAGDRGHSADVGVAEAASGARRWFANFAAAGSPADWAALSARPWIGRIKRHSVRAAYQLCNLGVIARRRLHEVGVALDDAASETHTVFAWFAANARFLGGGLDLGAGVRLDSGRLHVLSIEERHRWRLVRLLATTKRGQGQTPVAVERVTLTLPPPARLNLDGELWHLADTGAEVTLRVERGRVRWL